MTFEYKPVIPTQEQARTLIATFCPDPELILSRYRPLVGKQYFPLSWLQATAYLAVGGELPPLTARSIFKVPAKPEEGGQHDGN